MNRKQLFDAAKVPAESNAVSNKVTFKPDRKTGGLQMQSPEQKMLCALRKVLASMSDGDAGGCRYYIESDQVVLDQRPASSQGNGPKTYTAKGRCRIGVCYPNGEKGTRTIEFNIVFRDTKDDRGVDDVMYLGQTTIDELPRNAKL